MTDQIDEQLSQIDLALLTAGVIKTDDRPDGAKVYYDKFEANPWRITDRVCEQTFIRFGDALAAASAWD